MGVHKMLQVMAQLVMRHEAEISLMRTQDSWMLFLGAEAKGMIPLLLQESEQWKHRVEAQKQKFDPTLLPLRVHLFKLVIQEMLKAYEAGGQGELTTQLVKQQIILPDHTWPFLKWDAALKQQIVNPRKKALSMEQMKAKLEAAVEMCCSPDAVAKFHSLPVQSQSKVTPWRLQLPSYSEDSILLLRSLEMSSVDIDRSTVQTTHSSSIPAGSTSFSDCQAGQGQEQGQEEGHGQGSLGPLDFLGDHTRLLLQHQLMRNCLVNPSHWCYASRGFLSVAWALY